MLLVCSKRGLFLVLWRFRVCERRAGRRAEARRFVSALGGEQQSLSGSQSKEAGSRQDQSTFRIIFEICSGKGSDVRY